MDEEEAENAELVDRADHLKNKQLSDLSQRNQKENGRKDRYQVGQIVKLSLRTY